MFQFHSISMYLQIVYKKPSVLHKNFMLLVWQYGSGHMILQVLEEHSGAKDASPNNDPALVDNFLKQFARHLTQIGQRLLLGRPMVHQVDCSQDHLHHGHERLDPCDFVRHLTTQDGHMSCVALLLQ